MEEPKITSHPLDDWFIDYMLTPRKKVAMIVHGKTLFTFFISYEDAGGAKNIPIAFSQKLKNFLHTHQLSHFSDDIDRLFSESITFTKTADRKILGHMNDFIRCSQPLQNDRGLFDCEYAAKSINNMPVMVTFKDCTFPIDKFNALLNIKIPRRKY